MKKFIKLSFVFMFIILLSGCKGGKVVTKCTMTSDQSASGYKIKSTYNITSKSDIVNKVEIEEVVESKNKTILAYFKKQLKNQYKSYNTIYGGYEYEVTSEDKKVTSKVTVDYKKMNLKKFVKENEAMKEYVNKDNELTLKGIKTMYESMGAKCE